jgi:hypothetical protein
MPQRTMSIIQTTRVTRVASAADTDMRMVPIREYEAPQKPKMTARPARAAAMGWRIMTNVRERMTAVLSEVEL